MPARTLQRVRWWRVTAPSGEVLGDYRATTGLLALKQAARELGRGRCRDAHARALTPTELYDGLAMPRCGTAHVPPDKLGWTCTRERGHGGPCAAVPPTDRAPSPARSEGERVRLLEQIQRLEDSLASFRASLERRLPGFLLGEADAIADGALRLATAAARHDAYAMAERDRDA